MQLMKKYSEQLNSHIADEFINKLPDKYETLIGENGVRLIWWRKTKNFNSKSNA